ncbi:MAG: trypsin-like serine protease [Gammaproteobacteria bacterium]|nr:trypsin-like serine protease [Gammaproteobacteria bacterium]
MSKAGAGLRISLTALTSLALFVLAGAAEAIIIRHDVNARRHEVRAAEFPAVFYLEQRGGDRICAATVIHARWAITAAHCVHETSLGRTLETGDDFGVSVGGGDRLIDTVVVHPGYDVDRTQSTDLALLRFADTSTAPVITLQTNPTEQGQVATLVGWGFFGWGTTGREFSDGKIRMAVNRITEAGDRLQMRFDDPRLPDSDALPMEGTPGLWDSGGPALLGGRGDYRLAGVAVGELEGERFSEDTQGRYGAVAVYERISRHLDWIESVIYRLDSPD